MKNEKIINAWNKLNPSSAATDRIFEKIAEKQMSKHPVKRPLFRSPLFYATAATLLCVVTFGYIFLNPKVNTDNPTGISPSVAINSINTPSGYDFGMESNIDYPSVNGDSLLNLPGSNSFMLLGYILAEQEDGSIGLREVDIIDQPDVWGGYYNGESGLFYISVGLRGEGENIENVQFSVDEGFFATQSIGELEQREGLLKLYVGSENRLVMVGEDFDNVGSSTILDTGDITDILLIFWGIWIEESRFHDVMSTINKIDIHAKATFTDGMTAERSVTIDLSGMGVFTISPSDSELEKMQREFNERREYFTSIPLDELELIPESVSRLTAANAHLGYDELYFVYDIGYGEQAVLVQEEFIEFDEHDMFRQSFGSSPNGNYIVVLSHDAEGEIIGMLYNAPPFIQ